MNIKQKMIDAVAARWAQMDGKRSEFMADRDGLLGDDAGHYEGYCYEAGILVDVALDVLADPDNWTKEMASANRSDRIVIDKTGKAKFSPLRSIAMYIKGLDTP